MPPRGGRVEMQHGWSKKKKKKKAAVAKNNNNNEDFWKLNHSLNI